MVRWNWRKLPVVSVLVMIVVGCVIGALIVAGIRLTAAPVGLDQAATVPSNPVSPTPDPTTRPTMPPGSTPPGTTSLDPAFGIAAGSGLTSLSPVELGRYLDNVAQLGGAWVRFDLDWSRIEAAGPGQFDWAASDRVVAAAQSRGLSMLAVIGYAPQWAAVAGCEGEHCAPRSAADFGRFAGQAAERYRGSGLHHFEIWNEPNVATFFAPAPNVTVYAGLLTAATAHIRRANPDAFVMSGGTAPAASDGTNLAPLDFVAQLYDTDGGAAIKALDAVAHHPYTYPYTPANAYPGGAWSDLTAIHDEMSRHGDGAKPVWGTEYGAPTGGQRRLIDSEQAPLPAGEPVTERLQAAMAASAITAYRHYAWAGPLLWYSLRDSGTAPNDPEDHFGLLRPDGTPKPAYAAVKQAWK